MFVVIFNARTCARSGALADGVRVIETQQARARLVMERERIPKPLRSLRRHGTLLHLKLHPTFATGIHDERFTIEVEQRVKAWIVHIRFHVCYHRIITLSIDSLWESPRRTVAALISAVIRRPTVPYAHARVRELPNVNEGEPPFRHMPLFLRSDAGWTPFDPALGGLPMASSRDAWQ